MAEAGRARHSGTHRRGEDSRQRIIEAALEVFGHYGFEGASTRALADRAGVNLAAIPYYFGSKEGLYRAVAEHVAGEIATRNAPVVTRAKAALESPDLSKSAARQLLLDILSTFADTIIGTDDAEHWARFVMREQMDPTPAFDILYDGVMAHVHGVCTALVARLRDQQPDDADALIRTSTIIGQILIFRAARTTILRRLGWDRYTDARIAMIQAVIDDQVRMLLPLGGESPQ